MREREIERERKAETEKACGSEVDREKKNETEGDKRKDSVEDELLEIEERYSDTE